VRATPLGELGAHVGEQLVALGAREERAEQREQKSGARLDGVVVGGHGSDAVDSTM
jgi:hypothetical protein